MFNHYVVWITWWNSCSFLFCLLTWLRGSCELLPSLGVCCLISLSINFHILNISSETTEQVLTKSTNQKQELPVAATFVNGSGQNVHFLERTFYRCFLPSFSSFGWGVSEEKIKMWKVTGGQTTDAKWWQKLTLPLARWAKKHWY
jgi:hypothetical protein